MQYTEKFLALANNAIAQVDSVEVEEVAELVANGAQLLDIRDRPEHQKDHIPGSMNISRGTLEMLVEGKIADLDKTILCYCNANNRGALSTLALNQMGYHKAKFIAGGLGAYRERIEAKS